jgi:hypothetical protein
MIRRLEIIFTLLSLAWVSCSVQPQMAGGAGDETVIGRVLTPAGNPAGNAVFHLRSADYLSSPNGSPADTAGFADGRTDDNGFFVIHGVSDGSYRIEVSNDSSMAVMFDCVVDGSDDTTDLGSDSLRPSGTVAGHIDVTSLEGARLFAQVRGLERLVAVTADGKFLVHGLPRGTFDIRVVDSDLASPSFGLSGVRVANADTIALSMDPHWRFGERLYLNTTATGANVAEEVFNFPLLVRLDSTNFNFANALPSGQDVRVVKPDGAFLPYEIEEFDVAGKAAAIWVRMDTVHGNSQSQSITLLWGNPSAPDQSNGAAVFDTAAGFAGVWHLGEAVTADRPDATAYRNNGQTAGYDGDESTAGLIGHCDSLDMSDDAILVGDSTIATSLTLSLWLQMTTNIPWGHLIAKPLASAIVKPWMAYGLQIDSSDTPHFTFTVSTDSGSTWAQSLSTVPVLQWVYVTGTYDGSGLQIYYNGTAEGSASLAGTVVRNALKVFIGSFDNPAANQKFCGKIDEVRLSKLALGAAWIKLSYENQKIGSTMIAVLK